MIRKLLLHNMFIRAIKNTAVISVVAKLKFCFSLLVTFRKKGLLFFPIQDEALSPQSQLSPVSVCSESSGISVISPPAKRAPKRTSQAARGEAASTTAHLLVQLSSLFVCFVQKPGEILHRTLGLQNFGMRSTKQRKIEVVSN